MGLVPSRKSPWPKLRPILKQALIKPARRATKMPFPKLKSFTAFFFSSSGSAALFIAPATPMMAMPTRVTTTPMMTALVRSAAWPVNTGPRMAPRAEQVPRAMLCPRATPRYRILRPKVRPPTPHKAPNRMVSQVLLASACISASKSPKLPIPETDSQAPMKGNTSQANTPWTSQ